LDQTSETRLENKLGVCPTRLAGLNMDRVAIAAVAVLALSAAMVVIAMMTIQ
jgi:hypothetical protein